MRIVSCSVVLILAVSASAQKSGDPFVLPATAKTPAIKFRYCDKGDHIVGDPKENKTKTFDRGFYIAETELSQGAFEEILKNLTPAAREQWTKRGARTKWVDEEAAKAIRLLPPAERPKYPDYETTMTDEGEANAKSSLKGKKAFLGKDKPVFCVGLHEAALVCDWLNKSHSTDGPIKWQFRLPTNDEWDYAARGRPFVKDANRMNPKEFGKAAQNFPYFNNWRFDELSGRNQGTCKSQWAKAFPNRDKETPSTQEKMVELLREIKKDEDKLILLERLPELFLDKVFGGKPSHDFNTLENSVFRGCSEDSANGWHIHHMHGNVAEWALPNADLEATWQALLSGKDTEKVKAFVRGGHFRHGGGNVGDLDERWRAFTIGHPGAEKTYKQASETEVLSSFAGIRLVMTREADPARWFARLRTEVADGPLPAREWLAKLDAGLKQIAEADREDVMKASKQIAYLRTQYLTRTGDRAGAADALAKVTGDTPDEELFLGALGTVLKADAAKK